MTMKAISVLFSVLFLNFVLVDSATAQLTSGLGKHKVNLKPVNIIENFPYLSYCRLAAINHRTTQNRHIWSRLDLDDDGELNFLKDIDELSKFDLQTGFPAVGDRRKFDLDCNGTVNLGDLCFFCQLFSEKASFDAVPIGAEPIGLTRCYVAGDADGTGVVNGTGDDDGGELPLAAQVQLGIEDIEGIVIDAAGKGNDLDIIEQHRYTPGVKGWSEGNFNGDTVCDGSDWNLWNSHNVGPESLFMRCDIDGDGDYDLEDRDLAYVSIKFQIGLADVTGDGIENESDYRLFHALVFKAENFPVAICEPALEYADVNMDRVVDQFDLDICNQFLNIISAWLPSQGNVDPETWNFRVDNADYEFIEEQFVKP